MYAQPSGNSFACNSGVGYVNIPDNNYLDLQDSVTIEMWINSCDTTGAEYDLVTKGWCLPDDAAYYFYVSGKKLHWQFVPVGSGSCSNVVTVSSNNQFLMLPNTWYHIAVSHSALGGVKMYVNGVFISSTFITGSPAAIRNSAEPLLLNVYKNAGGGLSNSISGKIDEVRLWKRIRTATDISSNMNISLTGNELGLVAYYKFEQTGAGSGISVVNSATISGAAINGVTSGTVTGVPAFVNYNSVIAACAYTGINEYSSSINEVLMFPNPSTGVFTLKMKDGSEIQTVQIIDLNGRVLFTNAVNSYKADLNIAHLNSGLYTLRIINLNRILNERIGISK
jgi:hypothetical protein